MADCPRCGAALKPWSLRGRFKCHACSAPLEGQIFGPLIATLVLWQLADFFIYPLVHALAGTDWTSVLIRSLISACVGFSLYALFVSMFARVEISGESQSAR